MRVALTVVAYRSSAVLPACLVSFRREAAAAGVEAEVIIVEQSEDQAEAGAAAALEPEELLVRPNQGYAAGINVGVAAGTGDVILVANPDVELLEGSLSKLLSALEEGFAVVGPRLVWDRKGTVNLPVPEDPAPSSEVRRAARRRWPVLWRKGLGGWLDTIWELWTATGAIETPSLRGPALAFRRQTFTPWDEGYFLYYEETEWLWQLRRAGRRLGIVPGARVFHHWGHATRHLDGRQELEAASRRRFLRRTMGPLSRAALRAVDSGRRTAGVTPEEVPGPRAIPEHEADLWLLSPFPHLMPAAGWVGGSCVPQAVVDRTREGRWYAAAADRSGGGWRLSGAWCWGVG